MYRVYVRAPFLKKQIFFVPFPECVNNAYFGAYFGVSGAPRLICVCELAKLATPKAGQFIQGLVSSSEPQCRDPYHSLFRTVPRMLSCEAVIGTDCLGRIMTDVPCCSSYCTRRFHESGAASL